MDNTGDARAATAPTLLTPSEPGTSREEARQRKIAELLKAHHARRSDLQAQLPEARNKLFEYVQRRTMGAKQAKEEQAAMGALLEAVERLEGELHEKDLAIQSLVQHLPPPPEQKDLPSRQPSRKSRGTSRGAPSRGGTSRPSTNVNTDEVVCHGLLPSSLPFLSKRFIFNQRTIPAPASPPVQGQSEWLTFLSSFGSEIVTKCFDRFRELWGEAVDENGGEDAPSDPFDLNDRDTAFTRLRSLIGEGSLALEDFLGVSLYCTDTSRATLITHPFNGMGAPKESVKLSNVVPVAARGSSPVAGGTPIKLDSSSSMRTERIRRSPVDGIALIDRLIPEKDSAPNHHEFSTALRGKLLQSLSAFPRVERGFGYVVVPRASLKAFSRLPITSPLSAWLDDRYVVRNIVPLLQQDRHWALVTFSAVGCVDISTLSNLYDCCTAESSPNECVLMPGMELRVLHVFARTADIRIGFGVLTDSSGPPRKRSENNRVTINEDFANTPRSDASWTPSSGFESGASSEKLAEYEGKGRLLLAALRVIYPSSVSCYIEPAVALRPILASESLRRSQGSWTSVDVALLGDAVIEWADREGEVALLIGERGCGKSMACVWSAGFSLSTAFSDTIGTDLPVLPFIVPMLEVVEPLNRYSIIAYICDTYGLTRSEFSGVCQCYRVLLLIDQFDQISSVLDRLGEEGDLNHSLNVSLLNDFDVVESVRVLFTISTDFAVRNYNSLAEIFGKRMWAFHCLPLSHEQCVKLLEVFPLTRMENQWEEHRHEQIRVIEEKVAEVNDGAALHSKDSSLEAAIQSIAKITAASLESGKLEHQLKLYSISAVTMRKFLLKIPGVLEHLTSPQLFVHTIECYNIILQYYKVLKRKVGKTDVLKCRLLKFVLAASPAEADRAKVWAYLEQVAAVFGLYRTLEGRFDEYFTDFEYIPVEREADVVNEDLYIAMESLEDKFPVEMRITPEKSTFDVDSDDEEDEVYFKRLLEYLPFTVREDRDAPVLRVQCSDYIEFLVSSYVLHYPKDAIKLLTKMSENAFFASFGELVQHSGSDSIRQKAKSALWTAVMNTRTSSDYNTISLGAAAISCLVAAREPMSGLRLDGIRVRGANLANANLYYTSLIGVDFSKCNLTSGTIQRCFFVNANLKGVQIGVQKASWENEEIIALRVNGSHCITSVTFGGTVTTSTFHGIADSPLRVRAGHGRPSAVALHARATAVGAEGTVWMWAGEHEPRAIVDVGRPVLALYILEEVGTAFTLFVGCKQRVLLYSIELDEVDGECGATLKGEIYDTYMNMNHLIALRIDGVLTACYAQHGGSIVVIQPEAVLERGKSKTNLLYDLCALDEPFMTLTLHREDVNRLVRHGNFNVVSCSVDGTVRFWDMTNGELLTVIPIGFNVLDIAFSRNEGLLACACEDRCVRLFSCTEDICHYVLSSTLLAGTKVTSVAISQIGDVVYGGGVDGDLTIWPLLLMKSEDSGKSSVTIVAYNNVDNQLWTASEEGVLTAYETVEYSEVNHIQAGFPISALAFPGNPTRGRFMAIGSERGETQFWVRGKMEHELCKYHGRVSGVAFSEGGLTVLSCSEDHCVRLHSIDGTELWFYSTKTSRCQSCHISSFESIIAIGTYNGVHLLNIRGEALGIIDGLFPVNGLRLLNRRVIVAGDGKKVRIWKYNTEANAVSPAVMANPAERTGVPTEEEARTLTLVCPAQGAVVVRERRTAPPSRSAYRTAREASEAAAFREASQVFLPITSFDIGTEVTCLDVNSSEQVLVGTAGGELSLWERARGKDTWACTVRITDQECGLASVAFIKGSFAAAVYVDHSFKILQVPELIVCALNVNPLTAVQCKECRFSSCELDASAIRAFSALGAVIVEQDPQKSSLWL